MLDLWIFTNTSGRWSAEKIFLNLLNNFKFHCSLKTEVRVLGGVFVTAQDRFFTIFMTEGNLKKNSSKNLKFDVSGRGKTKKNRRRNILDTFAVRKSINQAIKMKAPSMILCQ